MCAKPPLVVPQNDAYTLREASMQKVIRCGGNSRRSNGGLRQAIFRRGRHMWLDNRNSAIKLLSMGDLLHIDDIFVQRIL